MMSSIMRSESLTFSTMVRTVARQGRRMGLTVPVFRSPPRLEGATRTVCARHGSLVIAVASRGRPFSDVAADIIEGMIVANDLRPSVAQPVRRALLEALEAELPPSRGPVTTLERRARVA